MGLTHSKALSFNLRFNLTISSYFFFHNLKPTGAVWHGGENLTLVLGIPAGDRPAPTKESMFLM